MKNLFFLVLTFLPFSQIERELKLVKSINIDSPTEVSIDRGGNIYYSTFHGDVIQLNSQLNNETIFSPLNPNTSQMLEAWQGLRVFSFHRDLQQYRLINRNLSLHEDYSFPPDLVGFAEMATPSFDNNIWVIDQIDFSLVKYDINSRRLLSRTPLDQLLDADNYEIFMIKEYQNKLFISTRQHGILIFDNMGSYLKTFQYSNISFFNFWRDELYFLNDDKLVRFNLYDESASDIKLPSTKSWNFALVYESNIYLFSEDSLSIYQ